MPTDVPWSRQCSDAVPNAASRVSRESKISAIEGCVRRGRHYLRSDQVIGRVTICQHEEVAAVASGVRLTWMQIPAHVRAGIEAIIGGGAVVSAVSQSGGFSPGTADRVVTADGRRAFCQGSQHHPQRADAEHAPSRSSAWSVNSHPIPTCRRYSASTTTVRGSGWCLRDVDGHTPAECRGTQLSSRLP